MDAQHARSIAARADAIRPALDASTMTPRRYAILMLFAVVTAVVYQSLGGLLRHWGMSISVSMTLAAGPTLLCGLLIGRRLRVWRAAVTRSVTDKMLCPRCRYILREKGPAHWDSCDSTIRVCPECANAVADDVYAAAALPALRARLRQRRQRSLRGVIEGLWPIPMFFGGMLALPPLGRFLERLGLADANLLGIWGILVVFLVSGVCMLYAVPRLHRVTDRKAARWLDAPFCVECDAPFPPGSLGSPILWCTSCTARMSTAVAVTDSRKSRRGLTLD